MDIYLESTDKKRLDLCLEVKTNYDIKERKFCVRHDNRIVYFENLKEAWEYYQICDMTLADQWTALNKLKPEQFGTIEEFIRRYSQ